MDAMVPVMLVHCATEQSLRVEDVPYPNDFGVEWEVTAHSLISTLKKSVLVHTFKVWMTYFTTGHNYHVLHQSSGQNLHTFTRDRQFFYQRSSAFLSCI